MAIGTETYRVRTDGAVIQLYNGATLVQSVTATPGIVRLMYDGTKVRVLNDGLEIITQSATAGQKLFPKVSPYNTGVRIYDIKAGPAGLQPQIGTTLTTSTGAATSDPAILNSAVTITAGGVLSGAGGGTVTIGALTPNGVDDLADGTTYKRFQLVERTKLTGVATGATVGAVAGTNLLDSGFQTLTDALIKNSAVTISAGGVLSGAGGGSVTIGGLGFLGDLSATRNRLAITGTDPGSVEDGYLWVDTTISGQPVFKTRLSAAWTAAATYGARAGLSLFDSASASLTDSLIKNSAVTLSAAGVLGGAGGGTINALNLLNGPSESGSDVTSNVTGPTDITLYYDSSGTAKVGQLPTSNQFKLYRNGSLVTSGITWTFTVLTGTVTGAISGAGTGVLAIDTLTSSSKARVTASYSGVSRIWEFTVTRVQDPPPPPAGQATTVSDANPSAQTGATYGTQNTTTLTVKTGVNGTINFTAPLEFYLSGTLAGALNVYGKWLWRVVAGTYADVAVEILSVSPASRTGFPDYFNDPGYLEVTQSKTGLTANTNYEVYLDLRNASGTRTITFIGTCTATGS